MREARKWQAAACWILLAGALALLAWRCYYTFCWSDESFYLAIAHRFWLGELPMVDEWNPEQIYAVLLLPFYGTYRLLHGSTEGIYLAARLVYTLLSGGIGCALFCLLQKKGRAPALAAALLFLFYSKANIGGLSYYNMALCFFVAGLLFVYCWQPDPHTGILRGVAAGVAFSLGVLCTPFLAVGWLALLPALFAKKFRRYRPLAGGILGGTALAAALYLFWLLGRVGPAQILASIPNLLSDPEANARGLTTLLNSILIPVYQFRFGLPLWGGALAYTLWLRLARRTPTPRQTAVLFWVAAAGFVINLGGSYAILGKGHAALCLFGFQCWLLTPRTARTRRLLPCFFVPGLAFAVVWQISSNTRFSSMTLGFAVSAIAACFMVWDFLRAAQQESEMPLMRPTALYTVCALALAAPVALGAWQRVALEYRDAPLSECSATIMQGPAQGLHTSEVNKAQYDAAYEVLSTLPTEGHLLISTLMPWGYLCQDRPVGAPSTWRTNIANPLLEGYFSQRPENFPTQVLILDEEIGSYVSTLQPEENPVPNLNDDEGPLLEMLAARGYTSQRVNCGVLWSAPAK